jgi:hypothetical protein
MGTYGPAETGVGVILVVVEKGPETCFILLRVGRVENFYSLLGDGG